MPFIGNRWIYEGAAPQYARGSMPSDIRDPITGRLLMELSPKERPPSILAAMAATSEPRDVDLERVNQAGGGGNYRPSDRVSPLVAWADTGRGAPGLLSGTPPDIMGGIGRGLRGAVNWLGETNVEGGPNRLEKISRVLSGMSQRIGQSLYDPRVSAFGSISGTLGDIKQEEYQQRRQEIMDRIAQLRLLGKGKETDPNAPKVVGNYLVKPTGEVLFAPPQKPEKDGKYQGGDIGLIQMVSDPNATPEQKALAQQQLDWQRPREPAALREPAAPGWKHVETDEGIFAFNEGTGESRLVQPLKPKAAGGELSTPEINAKMQVATDLDAVKTTIQRTQEVIDANKLASGGKFVEAKQWLNYFTDPEKYQATAQLEKAAKDMSNSLLKITFPGAIANEERRALEATVAAINEPPEVRAEIYARAMRSAQAIKDRLQARYNEISSGKFGQIQSEEELATGPAVGPAVGPAPTPPERQLGPGENIYARVPGAVPTESGTVSAPASLPFNPRPISGPTPADLMAAGIPQQTAVPSIVGGGAGGVKARSNPVPVGGRLDPNVEYDYDPRTRRFIPK